MDWWEEAATYEPGIVYTVKPRLEREWLCSCGRPWPSARSRASHRSRCAVEKAVRAWELARFEDILARARARLEARRAETIDTPA